MSGAASLRQFKDLRPVDAQVSICAYTPKDQHFIEIALRAVSPMIWRRLRVSANTQLANLHPIIRIAMGRGHEFLHCFYIDGEDYGIAYDGLQTK